VPTEQIPVSGGLVTSRDASTLAKGELSRADDAEYLPDDVGVWPVPGRTAFNSTGESGPIRSVGFLEFDPGVARFVALVGSAYRVATAGPTGTFSDLLTGLSGGASQFDQAFLSEQHILFNGVDRNRVVSSDLSTQPQGMLPNVAPPVLARDGGVGAGFTLLGTIFYWIEERVKVGTSIIRRNGATSATTVALLEDGTNDKPLITRPPVVNADATHWALFGTEANGVFPVGAEIAEVPIATTSIEDTRTTTAFPAGQVYPTVAIELLGEATTVPKYGQPPISTTGDVFEGSIVQNDVANPSHVRYTFPDDIHASPSVNLINMRTKLKDIVVWVRTLGRGVMIGMRDSLWRIDTLPRPEDAAFETDRVKTEIEGAFGGVSPRAVAKFSFGQGTLLAYVTPSGVVVTDGVGWDVLTADIDWEGTVNVSALAKSLLINNPRRYRLEFYYTPAGGDANTRALYFHYHPSHVKQSSGGGLRAKVTGPIHAAATGALVAQLNGQYAVFTAHTDGRLYREGFGVTDESGAGGIVFDVRTGSYYLAGVGMEATFRRGWIHHSAGAVGQTATVRQVMEAEGETPTELDETIPVDRREATAAYREGFGDAFQFGVTMTNPVQRVRINHITVEYDPAKEEQSP